MKFSTKQKEWCATPGASATISELSIKFLVTSKQQVSFSYWYVPINIWKTDTQDLEELNKIMFKSSWSISILKIDLIVLSTDL